MTPDQLRARWPQFDIEIRPAPYCAEAWEWWAYLNDPDAWVTGEDTWSEEEACEALDDALTAILGVMT